MKSSMVLFPLGTIPNVLVTVLVEATQNSAPSVLSKASDVISFALKSLSLSRLSSHQPASLRQAVCKRISQLARPRLINDERQAGFQVHKSHSVESRSVASPKPISWQKSGVPGASQIP